MSLSWWSRACFVMAVLALLALARPTHGDLGWAHLRRHDLGQARAAFTAQLAHDAGDADAWLGLASVYDASGDWRRHVLALETTVRRFPANRKATTRLVQAYEMMTAGAVDPAEDIERLEAARIADPRDADVRARLVAAYRRLGDGARAIRVQRELVDLAPADRGRVLGLARLLVGEDRAGDAIPYYERVLRGHPGDADTALALAQAHEWTGRPRRALIVLEPLAVALPGDRGLNERVATLAESVGDTERAVAALDRLAPAGSDDRVAARAVDLLIGARRLGDAIRRQEAIVARHSQSADQALRLAQLYDWTNQPAKALVALEHVATLRPGDRALSERILARSEAAGDPDRAVAVLDRLARETSERRHTERAVEILVAARRLPEAIARQRALAETHADVDAYARKLAQLYEWTNDPARALSALEPLAARRTGDRALVEKTVALALAASRPDRALGALERLAHEFPAETRYAQQIVDVLVAAGRIADAIPRLRRIVDGAAGAPVPALRLAQLYEWTGREREAIGVYEMLDRAGHLPEAALARLGELYRFHERPADFVRIAERLLARRRDDDALRTVAVDAALWAKRPEQALRLLGPAVERRPHDEALALRYLTIASETGRIEEGLKLHRRLAASRPPSVSYRGSVARLLTDTGRYADAITEHQAIVAAFEARPEAPERLAAHVALAQLYDWTGEPARALAEWESVVRVRASDTTALREVGRRSLMLSRQETALVAFRAVLGQQPNDREALKRVGQLLAWSRDRQSAKTALERFTRVHGGDYEVHFALAEIYRAERDEPRARAEYEKALRLMPARR
ncbi:MAG TPA: tetratricopeptide repeat protein [Methylomirabilota bacterium]|jgi:tetratricopeptide (TPR) repeat protein|nr:tetratricopeptide repeat protein [Methylomirabilota bacterium]